MESLPCHLQRAKNKYLQQKPDQTKKKKQVSSWAGCIWATDFPEQKPGQNRKKKNKTKQNKTGQFPGRLYLASGFFPGKIGILLSTPANKKLKKKRILFQSVTWLWPSAAQAEVRRPPDWSTVDVPSAGTPCFPQVETIPASAFSPPSNLPPCGLIAIFLLVNPPVMVASSVVHCSFKERRQTQAMLQQQVCN
jgi:hypothetical protein